MAAVGLSAAALSSSADTADRLAAAGDVLVGATLLLAVIAALVGLLAYGVSTGSPDLRLSVHFEFSGFNKPAFESGVQDNGWLKAKHYKQTSGKVSLHNDSGYSAKNPALIVRLNAMAFLPGTASQMQPGLRSTLPIQLGLRQSNGMEAWITRFMATQAVACPTLTLPNCGIYQPGGRRLLRSRSSPMDTAGRLRSRLNLPYMEILCIRRMTLQTARSGSSALLSPATGRANEE